MTQHSKPCPECPWRRASAPGWLGNSTALEFVEQAESGIKMPCHLAIDYDDAGWRDQVDSAPHCAGHATYLANRCKIDRPLKEAVKADYAAVFFQPQEFIDHHTHGKGPKVMIVGRRVLATTGENA